MKRSVALVLLALLAALVFAGTARATPDVAAKRAEAERVLAQIHEIDARLEHVVDAYNAAQTRLREIEAEERIARRRLAIARANYRKAQEMLEARLVALYQSEQADVLAVLLGATSVEEMLDRAEAVSRVSEEDARILREVAAFRAETRRRGRELAEAREEQERVIAERAARRRLIESQLAERRRLLAQVKDEIARLQAAAAERQRRLEAQARERLRRRQARAVPAAAPTGSQADAVRVAEAPAAPPSQASSPAPSVATSPPPARHGGVVGIAMQYLGVPYRWGGASPSTGFDCSGFVMYVYAQVGVALPHSAAAQYAHGTPVSRSQLQPGDLVFFNGLGHNGIYIGAGQFIHSPHTGDVVKISSLSESWYARTYIGARRIG